MPEPTPEQLATWHVTVTGFGHVSSFKVQARTAHEAKLKAYRERGVSVTVKRDA